MKTYQMMIVPFLVACLLSIGCQKKEDNSVQGGVDGSGGILPYWDEASFKDWVENDHRFFVRDVIHRIQLIQKNSPSEFDHLQKELQPLLGSTPNAWMQLANSVKYEATGGWCNSVNHPRGDAAVTSDGRICISYQAFKNIPHEKLISKLVSMSLHEMGHLKGLNEDQATKLQLALDKGRLGKQVNLHSNRDYLATHESLGRISQDLRRAVRHVLDLNSTESLDFACQDIVGVFTRFEEIGLARQTLPSYLEKSIQQELNFPIAGIRFSCSSKSRVDLLEKLGQILLGAQKVEELMLEFESPLCNPSLCPQRMNASTQLAQEELKLLKPSFEAKQDYTKIDPKKIKCEMLNLSTQKPVALVEKEYFPTFVVEEKANGQKIEMDLDLSQVFAIGPATEVRLINHSGLAVRFTDGHGFANDKSYSITGLLYPATQEKISVSFDLIQTTDRTPPKSEQDWLWGSGPMPFQTFDPVFFTIQNLPEIIHQLQLNCEVVP